MNSNLIIADFDRDSALIVEVEAFNNTIYVIIINFDERGSYNIVFIIAEVEVFNKTVVDVIVVDLDSA